jgi:hypothetical protein
LFLDFFVWPLVLERGSMGTKHGRGWVGWDAALLVWLGCVAGAAAGAQTATDGAIGGRVLSAAGQPVAGALVVCRLVRERMGSF